MYARPDDQARKELGPSVLVCDGAGINAGLDDQREQASRAVARIKPTKEMCSHLKKVGHQGWELTVAKVK